MSLFFDLVCHLLVSGRLNRSATKNEFVKIVDFWLFFGKKSKIDDFEKFVFCRRKGLGGLRLMWNDIVNKKISSTFLNRANRSSYECSIFFYWLHLRNGNRYCGLVEFKMSFSACSLNLKSIRYNPEFPEKNLEQPYLRNGNKYRPLDGLIEFRKSFSISAPNLKSIRDVIQVFKKKLEVALSSKR